MSTRYVYALKNVTFKTNEYSSMAYTNADIYRSYLCEDYSLTASKNSEPQGIAEYVAKTNWVTAGPGRVSSTRWPYCIANYGVFQGNTYKLRSSTLLRASPGYWWSIIRGSGSTYGTVNLVDADSDSANIVSHTVQTATVTPGSSIYKRKSSASKDITEGIIYEGDTPLWVSYLGSDTIDPYSVSYSKSELQGGESVGVSVNPRSPVYGGTVYYQFSYSIDNGSTWVNAGGLTTSLSVSITIPSGAKQFRARAVASDNLGFTSSTPIYGPSLGVSILKAYVGVSDKAKAVSKIYVGVNGKAREVIKGYIGVGGKARKFM